MLRLILICLLYWLMSSHAQAQTAYERDSLLRKLNTSVNDTTRVNILNALAYQYYLTKPDTTYLLTRQAYELALKLNFLKGQARANTVSGTALGQLGDYGKALTMHKKAREIYIKLNDKMGLISSMNNSAYAYMLQEKWQKSLGLLLQGYSLYKTMTNPDQRITSIILTNIGECYCHLKQLDSAKYYLKLALPLAKKANLGRALYLLGDVALAKNNNNQAYAFYQQSLNVLIEGDAYVSWLNEAYYQLAKFYQVTSQKDSTLHYAKLSLANSRKGANIKGILKSSELLSQLYEGNDNAEALKYYKIAVAAKDSLYSQDKMKQLISLTFEEKQQAQEIEAAKAEYRSTIRTYVFIGLLAVLGAIALVLYRNNRQKQQANTLLQRQRDEIHQQRTQLQESLETLKSAQTQLIQKEKMASLGELTAGIAHEIQNPLNFVNNFSEVSAELVTELEEEQHKPVRDADLEAELLRDLKQNLQKITHHGGRASAIVKGMLEHSRTGTGKKQLTNLNALADEYLKIAYHGLRAKDKDFNCALVTDFAPDLGKVDVMPQELGRVLLNLYNNAFYAVKEKQKTAPADYQPTVTVNTAQVNGKVEIRVGDTGTGMPDTVKAKIFQPFFTTKPTGEGTGLGLSLSYDIVTKGHQGSLRVESREGEGTEFVIQLPTANVSLLV